MIVASPHTCTHWHILIQMVVAVLTRKTSVTLVTMNSEEKIQLTQDEVAKGIEIEERIVNTVVA